MVIPSIQKACYCCKHPKDLTDFGRDKYTKDGHRPICKPCASAKTQAYHAKNPTKARAILMAWREENRQYWLDYLKHLRGKNPTFQPKTRKMGKTREEARAWVVQNKHEYDIENKEKNATYVKSRRKEVNALAKVRRKEREQVDLAYKVTNRLRTRLRNALNGSQKAEHTLDLLGCPLDFFLRWIERNFENGMSWDNYGYGKDKWHIDHNLPCISFDMTNPEHQKQCFHWTNLFPMWARHNMAKADSLWVLDYEI